MDYPDSPDLYEGKFTDGDPVAGIPASVASAEHMNAVYDELAALIAAGGIAPDAADLAQVAKSVGNQLRSRRLFDVSGDENDIVLTTPDGRQPVTSLSDYDEFSFIVSATNSLSTMTVKIDGIGAFALRGVNDSVQVIQSALLTIRYLNGGFYLAEQVNPATGNPVSEIGLLKWQPTDAMSVGMMIYDGGELSRATHPILFAKAMKTGLMDQSTKDADLETYGGFWGDGDGATTFTLPLVDKIVKPTSASRSLGSYEGDAIRNIIASFGINVGSLQNATGAMSVSDYQSDTGGGTAGSGYTTVSFDASSVVPTGPENTPKTTAFHPVFLV